MHLGTMLINNSTSKSLLETRVSGAAQDMMEEDIVDEIEPCHIFNGKTKEEN